MEVWFRRNRDFPTEDDNCERTKLLIGAALLHKNGRLVKKIVLDSQKGEKRHFGHNFFKIGHSELFIALFCLLLTH